MTSVPAALLLAAALAAPPQGGGPSDHVVVFVRDPSGSPVKDADALFWPDPRPDLPVLEGLAPWPPPRAARGDAGGTVRVPAAPGERGTLLLTTTAGLGAVAPNLVAGEAQRIAMAPMAEVSASPRDGEFVLWASFADDDGSRARLGPFGGAAVRLPAGTYEVWARRGDTFVWRQLALRSGERAELRFDGPTRDVIRAERAVVHPSGWPDVVLLGEGLEQCTLAGAALAAPLTAFLPDGRAVANRALPGPPEPDGTPPLRWPPPSGGGERIDVKVRGEAGLVAAATAWSLRRTDRETWRLLGLARAADGAFALERPSGGDDWVLVTAPGARPAALPWPEVAAGTPLELRPGSLLRVDCTGANGEPAAGVALEYVPEAGELAAARAWTDPRGRAWFADVAGPGTLLVVDPRWANAATEIVAIVEAPVRIALRPGLALRGRAVLPDGAPAAGATITMRDPSGALRPAERTVIAGPDGRFRFEGLGEQPLVLFATQQRDGRTWSAKRAGLLAAAGDGAALELVLRSEDPELPGPAGLKR